MSGAWHPPADVWAISNVGTCPSAHGIGNLGSLDHPALDASGKAT